MDIEITQLPPGWTREELIQEATKTLFGMAYSGICVACGEHHDGIEPDAVGYICASCGEYKVCGVEYIFISLS